MAQSIQAIKQRYFDRVYAKAAWIKCACGCGRRLKEKDRYARFQRFVNGHNRRKYSDPKQYKREWNHRNRRRRQEEKMSRHRRLKVKLIKILGGRCFECRILYNGKNAGIFHFHHRNSTKKKFNVGNELTNRSWKKILAEAKKCNLLCANCHEMKHSRKF